MGDAGRAKKMRNPLSKCTQGHAMFMETAGMDMRTTQVNTVPEEDSTDVEDAKLFRQPRENEAVYDSPESSGVEETALTSEDLQEQQRSYELRVQKERWPNAFEGLAAAASYVIGIGNVWFFPFMCARYGGTAFLVPYGAAYLIVGIPMMYIEMTLGQYTSMSPYMIFDRLCNGLSGIAPAMFTVVLYRSLFFSGILANALYVAFFALGGSFWELPWKSCDFSRASRSCFDLSTSENCQTHLFNLTGTSNFSKAVMDVDRTHLSLDCRSFVDKMYMGRPRVPPYTEYIMRHIFKPSSIIEDMEPPNIGGFICLLVVWIVTAALSTSGVRGLGKASYALSIAPLLSILFIFIKSFTYENSLVGIGFFLTPDFDKILNFGAWSDAVILVLFSLSVGDGGLMKIAMHNKFNNNVMRDVFLISSLDFAVSLISGVAFFGFLGELGRLLYPESAPAHAFKQLMVQGESLAFTAFPELVSRETLGWLQMAIFYFTAFFFGLQSLVTSMDVLVTSLLDVTGIHRYDPGHFYLILKLFLYGFVCAVFSVLPSGIFAIMIFDVFANFSLLFICVFEVIAIIYIYGFRRFASNIQTMMGGGKRRIYAFWCANWLFLTPMFMLISFLNLDFLPNPELSGCVDMQDHRDVQQIRRNENNHGRLSLSSLSAVLGLSGQCDHRHVSSFRSLES
uniref:Transporter n=1 Tax=Steinernema glaseri TaxID=37863 RepID=A0A1I7Z327_9BILA